MVHLCLLGASPIFTMTRTPPNRRGIKFEVGAPLEARDSLKNWSVISRMFLTGIQFIQCPVPNPHLLWWFLSGAISNF